MPTVIATVGSDSANSYVTVAETTVYFAESFGRSLWANASQSDLEAAVITASRSLDQYIDWIGFKSTVEQSMEWPRYGAYDKTGIEYSNSIVPGPVKFATMELAYFILQNGGLAFDSQMIDRVKVGSLDVEFTPRSVDAGIPSFIESLISHIGNSSLVDTSMARSVDLIRS